ncbi:MULTISPECIES: hypothetical protein [unclassified Nonomuraea]
MTRMHQLTELLDALDAQLPAVPYRIRHFPEGEEFVRLGLPDSARSIVYVSGDQWICVGEDRSGLISQRCLGRVGEAPEEIVSRLATPLPPPRPRSRVSRLVRTVAVGVASGAAACVLAAIVIAVLVLGNGYGYGSDVVHWTINALAAGIGVGVGFWVAWRYHRAVSRCRKAQDDG